jgi:hypothetical protein
MKYLGLVAAKVEKSISRKLPSKFGLVIDGWSDSSVHYVGLFACFHSINDVPQYPLLAFSPLLDESDLSANSYRDWIDANLHLYGKTLENVAFLVGDNCSVNQSLCDIIDCGFIGCSSHRLNLTVKEWIVRNQYEQIIDKVHNLMLKLKSVKNRAKLRELTELSPLTRNTTRWPSTYKMIDRYLSIEPCIDVSDPDIADRSLSPSELLKAKILKTALDDFESINLAPQRSELTMSDVRACFDEVMQKYVDFGLNHLAIDSRIVKQKNFENAILKIQRGQESELTACEKVMLKVHLRYI